MVSSANSRHRGRLPHGGFELNGVLLQSLQAAQGSEAWPWILFHFRGAGARSCMLDGELSESSWINYKARDLPERRLEEASMPNDSKQVEICRDLKAEIQRFQPRGIVPLIWGAIRNPCLSPYSAG